MVVFLRFERKFVLVIRCAGKDSVGLITGGRLQLFGPVLTIGKALVGEDAGIAEFGAETQQRSFELALCGGLQAISIL